MLSGDVVSVRHVWREKVWFVHPAIVVVDEPRSLVLFEPMGSIRRWSFFNYETGEIIPPTPKARTGTDALMIIAPDTSHAVSLFWVKGAFVGWYVDMQEPIRRDQGGVITWDRALDIVVAPDLTWKWKDEDHLRRGVELGWMAADEAREVRREGERVVRNIEARAAPFDGSWSDWRPNAAWPTPKLGDDWDTV